MESWCEQRPRRLALDWNQYTAGVSMAGSLALGVIVVAQARGAALTAFDLRAPPTSPVIGRVIMADHLFTGVQCSCAPQLHVRFLEQDPDNLLAVAWAGSRGSRLELVDVAAERVVETLSSYLGSTVLDMALATTKDRIAVFAHVRDRVDTELTLFRRSGASCWATERVIRSSETSWRSLSFVPALNLNQPLHATDLLDLQSPWEGGHKRPRLTAFIGEDAACVDFPELAPVWDTDAPKPFLELVQTMSPGVAMATVGRRLIALYPTMLESGTHNTRAAVVHTFDAKSRGLCAAFVPGHGMLVLRRDDDDDDPHIAEPGFTLHHFVRTTMSPARCTWLRACACRARTV